MNKNLYVMLLESDKYYVYYTDTENHDRIRMECIFISPFVKKYKPNKIIETLWNIDVFDIDKYVKKYMTVHGINNVRGGSYQELQLSHYQHFALERELEFISSHKNNSLYMEEKKRYFIYHEVLHNNINQEPKEIDKYNDILHRYTETQKKLSNLQFYRKDTTSYFVEKNTINRIEFLQSYIISRKFETEYHDPDIVRFYTELLPYLKHFVNIIEKNDKCNLTDFFGNEIEKDDENEMTVLVHHPEFIFDNIIYFSKYHPEYNAKIVNDDYIEKAEKICEIFKGMCWWCLNRIDEYEFDLKCLPENIEWKTEMIDYMTQRSSSRENII
jgi:hypothetical protein